MKGTIKKFDKEKRFGFIVTPQGEFFFHINTAKKNGLNEDKIFEGAEFEVEIGMGKKGKKEVTRFVSMETKSSPHSNSPNLKPDLKPTKFGLINYSKSDRNFYLFLNKPFNVKEHEKMFAKKENGELGFSLTNRFTKDDKFAALESFDFSGVSCAELVQRHEQNIKTLYSPNVINFNAKPDWRMTLGIGGASVYETDITLHHLYGIPYIPASSIKGVVRSFIIQEVFDHDEASAIMCKEFCDIFGCVKDHEIDQLGEDGNIRKRKERSWYSTEYKYKKIKFYEKRGAIYFFDAFPIRSESIKVSMDIMNVHYKKYYDAEKNKNGKYEPDRMIPPADWSSPTIINFLTVKNASFKFLLASKDNNLLTLNIDGKTIDQWLQSALSEHGIGAKTAVGYGYMNKMES